MERDTELNQLSRELKDTALNMQKMMGGLESALREQQHMQTDIVDMRRQLQGMDKLLREGDGGMSLTTRLVLVENRITDVNKRLDDFRETQKMGRDWWLKVLGNLTVAAIFAGAGLLLSLYLMSKSVPKPP